jgi:predicted amidophosphoribosyltransferase
MRFAAYLQKKVDDLFDSGATLEEITRVLSQAGAKRVCVLTLTRTIHSDT